MPKMLKKSHECMRIFCKNVHFLRMVSMHACYMQNFAYKMNTKCTICMQMRAFACNCARLHLHLSANFAFCVHFICKILHVTCVHTKRPQKMHIFAKNAHAFM